MKKNMFWAYFVGLISTYKLNELPRVILTISWVDPLIRRKAFLKISWRIATQEQGKDLIELLLASDVYITIKKLMC